MVEMLSNMGVNIGRKDNKKKKEGHGETLYGKVVYGSGEEAEE